MSTNARIITDSVSPAGVRLTTMEVTFHRFVLPEFNTHRVFSRNAASSRAIPIRKIIASVRDNPAMPIFWGANQPGMSARVELTGEAKSLAIAEWQRARINAIESAERLIASDINLHKQLVNRLLEPFLFCTMLVTSSQWNNFFCQRLHADAQPEIQALAKKMFAAYNESIPTPLTIGEWHLPLIQPDEQTLDIETLKKVSVARCARISYLTHDNVRDIAKDLELFERLLNGGANGHWSPMEHVATPLVNPSEFSGNIRGWHQYRKDFLTENAETLAVVNWFEV